MPGAGKTIMVAIVVNHLCIKYQNDNSIGIAYLYCNFRQQHEQKPVDLLASLLKQFIRGLPAVPESTKTLYERHKGKQTRASFDEISKELYSVIAVYSKCFTIIDALDECQVSDRGRQNFLSELLDLQTKAGASLFGTSRFIPEIRKEFVGKSASLEIRASETDVRRYLNGHMAQLPSFILSSPDLQEEIKTAIIKVVDGMFLLGQLYLGSLIGKRSPKALKAALKTLPTGSEAYDYAYKEAMDRIAGQVVDSQVFAKQILSWITCAKRPLTTFELQHALAVEAGESELDEENLPDIEDMVSVCAGLVTVNKENSIIRLVHYTTQEYFERTQNHWFPDTQRDITKACLTYLSFNAFETGFCSSDKEFEKRLRLYPLYDYAARNWGLHARAATTEVEQLILDFFKSEAKMSASSQAMMTSGDFHYRGDSQKVPRQMTGVHVAAYFGLREAMIALLENGYNPNFENAHGQTPLRWAAKNGHEAVVKLLLATDGVDPDSKDKYLRQTPLSRAAESGHETVVKLLPATDGIDPNSKAKNGRTPLSWASGRGNDAVVKLFLAKNVVHPDSKDKYGQTSLSWAAKQGHETVVKLFLATDGVNPNSKERRRAQTPLSLAASNGHEAVVKQLLAADDVDPDSSDENSRTPLSWAAENGHETVTKLLLAADAVDPDSKDKYGQTPLSWAAKQGREAIVKLLLATDGVNPDSKDKYWRQTPLLKAAESGREAVVKVLLFKNGVNPNSKDKDGLTPLLRAAIKGHEAVIKLLLAKDDVDRDPKDNYGWTPLLRAAARGHEAVVKLLLAKDGVDPDSKDTKYGQTPLSWAPENGHVKVVHLLLAKDGVDPDSKDFNYYRTPLSRAAASGHEAVVKLLLAADGVNPDSRDEYGRAPLSRAARNGMAAVVKLLLATHAVDPDSKDHYGRTALSWAAARKRESWIANPNHEAVMGLLLTNDCIDINTKDTNGRTPLSWAAGEGHYMRVKLLLAKTGINPGSKDDLGQTPLQWATKNRHEVVIKLLQPNDNLSS